MPLASAVASRCRQHPTNPEFAFEALFHRWVWVTTPPLPANAVPCPSWVFHPVQARLEPLPTRALRGLRPNRTVARPRRTIETLASSEAEGGLPSELGGPQPAVTTERRPLRRGLETRLRHPDAVCTAPSRPPPQGSPPRGPSKSAPAKPDRPSGAKLRWSQPRGGLTWKQSCLSS